jgi:hypothetical protein
MVCWRFLEIAKLPQIDALLRHCFSQIFRRFTRVAAQLLHASPLGYLANEIVQASF